jgi:putative SOS response-associated peptidase YedK
MARRREPLRGSVQLVQRVQQGRGRRHLVALDDTRPLACFAGIWTNWTSVRKVKGNEGETTNDLFAFLTTEPNAEVGAIHPKAMPIVLTTPEEVETWMTAAPDEALKLQRPLPDGALRIIARGVKEDPAGQTT